MRIGVEPGACGGFANCTLVCPEVFALDEETMSVRVLQQEVPDRIAPAALRAVEQCPTVALVVVDDTGTGHGAPPVA